ncbi:MAG: hypothetical protein CL557_08545 [Alphaproteobacteria bacterium]|nr:hypothetical protein [Alphaproteobacteria bacterium]|tara:strand:- start:4778 stop:5245 length:468 start_codon:yes stop_codon:yes gene_type:complete
MTPAHIQRRDVMATPPLSAIFGMAGQMISNVTDDPVSIPAIVAPARSPFSHVIHDCHSSESWNPATESDEIPACAGMTAKGSNKITVSTASLSEHDRDGLTGICKTGRPKAGLSEDRKGRSARRLTGSAADTNGSVTAGPSHDRQYLGLQAAFVR